MADQTTSIDPDNLTLEQKEEDTSFLSDFLIESRPTEPGIQSSTATRKAAQGALITNNPADFDSIIKDFQMGESSSTLDQIQTQAEAQAQKEAEPALLEIANSERTLSSKRLEIKNLIDTLDNKTTADFFRETVAGTAETSDEASKEQQEFISRSLSVREKKERHALQFSTKEFTFTSGLGENFFDTAMVMALPGFGVNVREVIEIAIPFFTEGFADLALTGDLVERFVQHMDSLSFEESKPVIERLVLAIENNKFFGISNGFMKYDLFNTLLEDLNPENVSSTLLNIVGVLDIVGAAELARIGGAAIRGVRTLSKIPNKATAARVKIKNIFEKKTEGSMSKEIDELAPENSVKINTAALEDPAVARAMGTTPEQITSSHLAPRPEGIDIDLSPALMPSIELILKQGRLGVVLTASEKRLAHSRVRQKQVTLENSMPQVHLNKSTIRATDKGYELSAVYGRTPARGFLTPAAAMQYFKNLDQRFFGTPEILVTNIRTGKIQSVKEVSLQNRSKEYWLNVKQEENFLSSDVLPGTSVLPNGITGSFARFFNKSASFIKQWALGGSTAEDVMSAKIATLNQILIPINTLGKKAQGEVLDTIDRGDQIGKWFSYDELVLQWGNRADYIDLIKGYQSFKVHQREARALLNEAVRNKAVGEKLKHITFNNLPAGMNERIGKVLSSIPEGLRKVYSPKENRIIDITETDLRIFERDNKQLVELNSPMKFGDVETRYTFIDDQSSLRELPEQLLKDQDGYVSRLYEISHLIREIVPITNSFGKTDFANVVIRGAKNGGDADRYLKELEASSTTGQKFDKIEARELRRDTTDDTYLDRLSLDYFEEQGQLFYSSRNDLELLGREGERILAPISKRLEAFRAAASRAGTLDTTVDKMVKQWELTFGGAFGREGGRIRLFGDLPIPKALNDISKRELRDARAARDHIKLVAGIDDSIATKAINDAVLFVAEAISTPKGIPYLSRARNWTSGKLIKNRQNLNPINLAKQGAFIQFIIGNPIRQLLLQSQQASLYLADDFALKYFLSGQGIKDYAGLVAGLAKRTTKDWDAVAPGYAKGLGMSVDEYTQFIDGMRQTGLLTNIDSHEFVSVMTLDSSFGGGTGLARARETAWNGAKRTLKLVRKYGFDAGEKSQLLAAYLTKRNKFIRQNPTKNWIDNIGEIGAEARQISLNMNQSGALQFQKGLTGLLMQFMSHNSKIAQVLIPQKMFGKTIGKLSDKSWNTNQKMALFANQSVFYGMGGWGLYETYDEVKAAVGIEPPEEIDQLIKEGLFGTLFSVAFRAFDDPDGLQTELDASGSVAPFSGVLSGTPIRRMIDTQIFSNYQLTDIPGISTGASVLKALETVGYLTGSGVNELLNLDPDTNLPADESVALDIMDTILRLMPAYDKFVKAKAQFAIQRFVTAGGTATVRATAGEILSSSLFGFQPTRRREIEGTLRTILGGAGEREPGYTEDLKTHAKSMYQRAIRVLQQRGDSIATLEEVLDLVKRMSVSDKIIFDDFDWKFIYEQYLPELIYNKTPVDREDALTFKEPEFELHDVLMRLVDRQELSTTDTILDRVRNFADFQGKEQYIEWLEAIRE